MFRIGGDKEQAFRNQNFTFEKHSKKPKTIHVSTNKKTLQHAAVACADQTKSRRREPIHAHAALILRVTCHERLIALSKPGLRTHFSNALPKIKQNKPNMSYGHDLRAGLRADFAQPIFHFPVSIKKPRVVFSSPKTIQ